MIRSGRIWIELTNKEGFVLLGDLAENQGKKGSVEIVCCNCTHKYTFGVKEVEEELGAGKRKTIKVWDLAPWRIFLRGGQVSQGKRVYYLQPLIEFWCSHCQGDLPNRA